MTLPASGQISMSQVRTELSLSGQISLGQSEVRTLFGVASGQIKLSDGYGKSAVTIYKPSTYTITNSIFGSVTNPANAYDSSTTTYAYVNSGQSTIYGGGYIETIVYSGFPSVTFTGTLTITNAWTCSTVSVDEQAEVKISVSTNGGSTYGTVLVDDLELDGSSNSHTTPYTMAISGLNLSNLRIKFEAMTSFYGQATITVYDIKVQ
jgi:hypothetical protein